MLPPPLSVTILPALIEPAAFNVTVEPLMTKPLAATVAKGMIPVAATVNVPWLTKVPPA